MNLEKKPVSKPARLIFFGAFLMVLASVVLNATGFMIGQDWGDDFAGYVIQAQVLANGDFGYLMDQMTRNDFLLNYPWGFPLLLVPVISQFDGHLVVVKLYVYSFFVLSLLLIYMFLRRRRLAALTTVALMASSPFLWYFKENIISDFPNLFFVIAGLYVIQRITVRREIIVSPHVDAILVGVVIFAGYFIRAQSAVLLITLAFMQVFYRRRQLLHLPTAVVALMPYLVFGALVLLVKAAIPVPAVTYFEVYSLDGLWKTIGENLFYYLDIWRELFGETLILQRIEGLCAGIFIVVSLTGIFTRWRSNLLCIVFSSTWLAVLMVTPFHQGLRYLLPLLPLAYYFFVIGLWEILIRFKAEKGQTAAGSVIGVVLILQFLTIGIKAAENYPDRMVMDGPYREPAREMFQYLRQKTPQTALIGFWKPRVILLYGNRNGIVPQNYEACIKKGAGYYVHYQHATADQIGLDELLEEKKFSAVFSNSEFRVFEVLTGGIFEQDTTNGSFLEWVTIIDHEQFDPSVASGPEKYIPLWSNGEIFSKPVSMKKGDYVIRVNANGTQARGEFPKNVISVNGMLIARFESREQFSEHQFSFALVRDTVATFSLRLENDLMYNNEDRNTMIREMKIFRRKEQ